MVDFGVPKALGQGLKVEPAGHLNPTRVVEWGLPPYIVLPGGWVEMSA